MACCIFNGCFNKPFPCGTLVFFNLPKDEPRRAKWLQLSGNEDVQNLPASARRLVCENHFEERYVRRQFHRTTLARDAVPMDHRMRKGDSSVIQIDEALDETNDTIKEGEAPGTTDKEEILLTLAIEEADYEVLIEHEPSEGSEPKDDLETHLIEDEESSEEHERTECNQNADCSDDLPRESDEVVETFEVDSEEAGEDHKAQEDVGKPNTLDGSLDVVTTREPKPDENFGHENMTGEQTEEPDELVEDVVIEEAESNEYQLVQLDVVASTAKHKLPNSVESSQQAKRFKNDEVVEPDTSSVSVTPAKPQAIEQPSTSSCTSSASVAPAPAGRMSEEEYFALSLVGPLQRLPPEKRAIAKMKILTYLVQLECGLTDANL